MRHPGTATWRHSVLDLYFLFHPLPFIPATPGGMFSLPVTTGFSACSNTALSRPAVFYSRLGQVAVANSTRQAWRRGRAAP